MKQPEGKYVLVKDPNKVRTCSVVSFLPFGLFPRWLVCSFVTRESVTRLHLAAIYPLAVSVRSGHCHQCTTLSSPRRGSPASHHHSIVPHTARRAQRLGCDLQLVDPRRIILPFIVLSPDLSFQTLSITEQALTCPSFAARAALVRGPRKRLHRRGGRGRRRRGRRGFRVDAVRNPSVTDLQYVHCMYYTPRIAAHSRTPLCEHGCISTEPGTCPHACTCCSFLMPDMTLEPEER